MSKIVNSPALYVVGTTDYSGNLAQDMYSRYLIESSQLPVIYSGLQVTNAGGLAVSVSAGSARGQNITVNDTPPVTDLPSVVTLAGPMMVTIPASSTGYVILQINAIEDVGGNQTWDIDISSNSITNDFMPVFVASLPTPGVDTYPFAYVVLAYVVSGVASITSISMAPYLGNRSFDYHFFYNPIMSINPWPADPDGSGINYILYSNGIVEFSGITPTLSAGTPYTVTLPFPISNAIEVNVSCANGANAAEMGTTTPITTSFEIQVAQVVTASSRLMWKLKGIAGVGSY